MKFCFTGRTKPFTPPKMPDGEGFAFMTTQCGACSPRAGADRKRAFICAEAEEEDEQ